jgi:hypothetical protein
MQNVLYCAIPCFAVATGSFLFHSLALSSRNTSGKVTQVVSSNYTCQYRKATTITVLEVLVNACGQALY